MLVRLPLERGVFGPEEISSLVRAYEGALCTITEDLFASRLSSREIRHEVALAVIAAAGHGQLDPDRLKTAALASLVGSAARDASRPVGKSERKVRAAARFLDLVPGLGARPLLKRVSRPGGAAIHRALQE